MPRRGVCAVVALPLLFACAAYAQELDTVGKMMLDPIRADALRPTETLARLRIRRSAIVADVGAGPGYWTVLLAERARHVIATDIRSDYLAVALERARAAGRDNVEARVVGADRPGLADRSVDLAFVCQVDQNFADRAAYFSALARALRTGGRIALVNRARFHDADAAAARAAGLRVVDEWSPSPPYFVMLLALGGV